MTIHDLPIKRLFQITVLTSLIFVARGAEAGKNNLKKRNYQLRIAIARNVDRIAFESTGVYQVVDPQGLAIYTIKPGESHFVDIIRGRSSGSLYRLVLRELEPFQEDNAITLARDAQQAYGISAKPIRMAGKTPGEPGRLFVTLGEFASLEDARAYQGHLQGLIIRQIFEEKTPAREGMVMIRDPRGNIVARNAESLRLVPINDAEHSLYLMQVKDSATWKSEQIKKARHYRGAINLAMDGEGKLTAVNEIWIEYYLYGVVAAEIGNFAPMEALKAQAVVARSEAVAKIERGIVADSPLYDFTDSAIVQTYKGEDCENDAVRQAVDGTRGEILVYRGRPADAVYSHSCGGVISSATDMWDSSGYGFSRRAADRLGRRDLPDLSSDRAAQGWTLRSPAVFCNPNQEGFPHYAKGHFRWADRFTGDRLTAMFDAQYDTGKIIDIKIDRRSPSARVRSMRVIGEKKTVTLDRELQIRRAFGDIRSTFFTLGIERDGRRHLKNLTINGAGFGHGVGMCQMGAFMMALKEYNYRQILGHYFYEVKIRKLYG